MREGMVVVDAHAHLQLGEHKLFGRQGRVTVEQQLARMDRFGIDAAIVIAHAWAGWTMEQYRHEHDAIARALADHRKRLIGFCWADPLLRTAAVSEFERCVTQLGYRGLKLHPVYQRFEFDDPVVYPLIEKARELRVPVTAHLDLRIPGCEPWRMVNLAHAFPDVTFVMGHMGRDTQALQDLSIARAAGRVANVMLEGSSTTTDAYGTFQGPAEILGPERVLYASDAGAFHHPAVNLLKIDLLEMPRAWKQAILGGNALRLLGLTAADVERAPDYARGHYLTPDGAIDFVCPAPELQWVAAR